MSKKNNNKNNNQPNYPGLWPPPPKDKHAPPSPERIPLGVRLGNPYDPAFQNRKRSESHGAPPVAGTTTQVFRRQTTTGTPTAQPNARPLDGGIAGNPPGRSYLSERLGGDGGQGEKERGDGKDLGVLVVRR